MFLENIQNFQKAQVFENAIQNFQKVQKCSKNIENTPNSSFSPKSGLFTPPKSGAVLSYDNIIIGRKFLYTTTTKKI